MKAAMVAPRFYQQSAQPRPVWAMKPGAILRAPAGLSAPSKFGRRNGCGELDLDADSSSGAIDEYDIDLPLGLVVPPIEDPGFQVRPPARRGQLLNDP